MRGKRQRPPQVGILREAKPNPIAPRLYPQANLFSLQAIGCALPDPKGDMYKTRAPARSPMDLIYISLKNLLKGAVRFSTRRSKTSTNRPDFRPVGQRESSTVLTVEDASTVLTVEDASTVLTVEDASTVLTVEDASTPIAVVALRCTGGGMAS